MPHNVYETTSLISFGFLVGTASVGWSLYRDLQQQIRNIQHLREAGRHKEALDILIKSITIPESDIF